MIEVRNLTKKYGNVTAVDNLSFDIEPGVITGFLGPNGAGKSTTMRMMVGLDTPTGGTVTFDGKPYNQLANPAGEVGLLLDAKWVHPKRTARAHLTWMAQMAGLPKTRVDEVLEIVGLRDVAKKKAGGFSLGMSQRLGLAGALLGDPKVLILDEPVNGLDPEGVRWVRDFLKAWAAQGRSVFVSSHLLSEMEQTADNLVVIGKGKLISTSTVAEFVGSVGKGFVQLRVPAEAVDITAGILDQMSPQTVQRVVDSKQRAVFHLTGLDSDSVGMALYSNGIPVLELAEKHGSLEDAFIQMTSAAVQYQSSVPSAAGQAGAVPSGDASAAPSGDASAAPSGDASAAPSGDASAAPSGVSAPTDSETN